MKNLTMILILVLVPICAYMQTRSGVFENDEDNGRAIYGLASATTTFAYGVYGESMSTSGVGVRGRVPSSSGITYGVYGSTLSTTGFAVYGEAIAVSGVNYGVYGRSSSPDGFDVYAGGMGMDYGSSSSRRWKRNVRSIDDPLTMLSQLRGVYFDWDAQHGGQHDIGMIAEEVGMILPEIVQFEENGMDAIAMDYSKITPLLIEAVNRLRMEKDEQLRMQKDEIAELRARLNALETLMQLNGKEVESR